MARDGGELVIERVVLARPLLSLLVSKVGACECLGFCAFGGFGFAWVFCRAEECLMRVSLLVGCSGGGGSSIGGSSSSSSRGCEIEKS